MCLRADAQHPTGCAARPDAAVHGGPHRHAGDKPHADARADSGPRDGDGHEQRHQDTPQIKDPTTWDDNAAKTLAGLKTQFAAYGLTLDAKEGCPYLLAVNNAGGVVTVYAVDSATKSTLCRSWRWCAAAAWTPHRVFFDPGGLQLAAADGPELRPVRDPHL